MCVSPIVTFIKLVRHAIKEKKHELHIAIRRFYEDGRDDPGTKSGRIAL